MVRSMRRAEEGWLRLPTRQLFLAGVGLPRSDILPADGWLQRTAIAFYVPVAILVLAIVALLLTQG